MKLYLVEASWCDYGQYDSFVVWAESPEEALNQVRANDVHETMDNFKDNVKVTETMDNFKDNVKVTEIKKPKESGIVLGLFNAG